VGSLKPGDVSPLPPETLNYNSGINGQPGVGGEKNTKGLIAPDQFLALMRNGLLLDVVHMGEASTEGAIQLGEKYQYPLMDSHTGLRDSQSIGPSERFLLLSHAARLAKLGGVLGLGTTGDPPSPLKNPCDMVHLNSCVKVADDAYQQCVAEREASKSVCTAVLSKALDACHSKFCSSRTRLANWVEGYLYALGAMGGRGVALGTDTNGLSPGFPPYSGGLTTYPFTPPAQPGPPNGLGPHPLSRFQLGTRLYDFYADGLANYGLLPDFLESLKELPGEQPVTALNALYRSAEDVIEMWEKVEAATRNIPPLPAPPCSTTECRSCTNQCDANLKACLGPEGPPNKITCSMVYQSCVQSCIVSVPPAPTFSLKSGSYRCPLAVTIAEQDPTTTIFYTTDGTKPTTSSSKYAGPLAVSASKTLNAIAFWSNGTASSASEVVYTCAAPPPSCPSSLPVFCYSDEQGKPVCVASGKTCPIRP
jgi:microsomal dipeptidase-like Zn-dependent dipeptidase